MASGEQVALEPALALVLAEHFHHAAGRREKLVVGQRRGVPLPAGRLEEGFEPVRQCFVGAEDPEIPLRLVQFGDVAQERPEHTGVADPARPGAGTASA